MGNDSTHGDLSATDRWLDDPAPDGEGGMLGLSVAWSLAEPDRVGQVVMVPDGSTIEIGRGEDMARFGVFRPGGVQPGPALTGRMLSRRQLVVTARTGQLDVRNSGSCALLAGGVRVAQATLDVGDVIELDRQLVLVAIRRFPIPEPLTALPLGAPDANGLVGESAAMWRVRAQVAFLARRHEPVLITGPSGTGKELAARAIHDRSSRTRGPWVARNAATLPATLIDAELFGNARNYPNAGMPDRPGLVGAAHEGSLFLDEIGELPEALQAHLLRVIDRDGTYQRLGEARERRSNFRFLAATNRDPGALKHDFVSRLTLSLALPGLDERREDIPLLVAHLLSSARDDPDTAERLFDGAHARMTPSFVVALLRHRYTTHVRELEQL
ncbi:MAG: sigma 54-interacting transcriptional regulator, partial [Myxococcota bacterium]